MKRGLLSGVCLILVLAAFSWAATPPPPRTEAPVKSVHLINVSESLTEDQILTALQRLNEAVHTTGHLDAGYVLWRFLDSAEDEYPPIGRAYIMEGIWPTQAIYDEVHASDAFQEAAEEVLSTIEEIHRVQLYSRYSQLAVGGPGEREQELPN